MEGDQIMVRAKDIREAAEAGVGVRNVSGTPGASWVMPA
jgi:hypothetical protein